MDLSRRRFLLQLTMAGGTTLFSPFPIKADTSAVWVPVGPAGSFIKGTWTRITLPAAQHKAVVYISHTADDSFLALSARCTHKGCEVEWDGDTHEFVCPCHNGRFDAQGKRTDGPPRKPLPTFPTKVDTAGQLLVQA